jgi:hypothetical protein
MTEVQSYRSLYCAVFHHSLLCSQFAQNKLQTHIAVMTSNGVSAYGICRHYPFVVVQSYQT